MVDAQSSMVPYGYQWNGCGYCGSRSNREDTHPSYYAYSDQMTPEHYQVLADRGWRRSGTTYYKPDLKNGCCPHYSIRLSADDFKVSKNQRKAVNAFTKYVVGIEYRNKAARLCPRTREQKRQRRHVFDVCQVIREPEYERLPHPPDPKHKGTSIEPAHKLEVTLESDEITDEKYELYANYQRTVHKEPPSKITKRSFQNFLCSGLSRRTDETTGKRLGSYHQCYRLDGELVAFGVLDLLPHAVSSVYVVYRDDVAHWQFGKLTALREIALARDGGYGWYYMGYYIHSCPKMKYKADYKPQFVLDVVTTTWHPLNQSFWQALDRGKLVGFDAAESKWEVRQSSSVEAYGDELPETLWDAEFVGVPSPEEVVESLPLSKLPAKLYSSTFFLEELLGDWDMEQIRAGRTLQTIIAELVACVGIDLAKEIFVDVGPYIRRQSSE